MRIPYLLIALGVVARLIPHPWNFTPVGALGLFAGANCNPRVAWLVPLFALVLGDIVLGFYSPIIMLFVYLGFLAAPVIGRLMIAGRRSVPRIGGAVVVSTSVFFVISNFGVWLGPYYPLTFSGLVECYIQAIPFYGATLVGDAFYATILFGGHHVILSAWSRRATLLARS